MYKNPDLWICLFNNYGCDEWELEKQCVHSAWDTQGGAPDAVFYPRVKLNQLQETTTEELQIEAIPEDTDYDSEGNYVEDVSLVIPLLNHGIFLAAVRGTLSHEDLRCDVGVYGDVTHAPFT